MNNSIKPGQVWLDTDGNRIQAHGGTVYFENGVYYWIGENKDHTTLEGDIWTWGIKCYSSTDLYNWKYEGYLVEAETNDENSIFNPKRKMDRPHLLYNERTKKYVLWLKYCDGAHYAVLTADNLLGPYTIINERYRPYDVNCGDFDLAKDEKTGQAYLYWEVNHTDLWGAKLNSEYTATEGEYVKIYENIKPPLTREGPAHLYRNGKHYLFTSGMTHYVPNPSEVAVSDDWLQGYKVQGNPHINDESKASFNSQISHIVKVQGQDKYIAIADRWIPNCLMDAEKNDIMARTVRSHYDPTAKVTDAEKAKVMPLLMVMFKGKADTSIANYVWLPIEFDGDKAIIKWYNEWRV